MIEIRRVVNFGEGLLIWRGERGVSRDAIHLNSPLKIFAVYAIRVELINLKTYLF